MENLIDFSNLILTNLLIVCAVLKVESIPNEKI